MSCCCDRRLTRRAILFPEILQPHLFSKHYNLILWFSLVERKLDDFGLDPPITDSNTKSLPNCSGRWRDVAHSNPKTERWRKCSARHLPNYISIRKNVLALPRNSLLHHLETNSNSTRSFFLQAHDRILTHKIRLLQTNNPVKPRLDRRSVLINIISIETHSRLKSQNISSTQPDRRNPYLSTTRQQFLPDLHRI